MESFNKKAYQRYFFYGDRNPEAALEGILFFSWQNDLSHDIKNDEEKLVKTAKELYKQYYRFIELNGKSGVYNPYRAENEKLLEEKIIKKIEELKNTDEIITEEQIQQKIREATKNKNGKRKEIIADKTRKEMEKRRTKKLFINENGLCYSIVQRFKYAHLPEGSITKEQNVTRFPEYIPYKKEEWGKKSIRKRYDADSREDLILDSLRHWTEDLYDLLISLKQIEQEDSQGYIDLWLRTRLNRAKNGTIEGIEEKEIKRIEQACKRMRQIRHKENEKER